MNPTLIYYLDDEPDLGEVFCELIQSQQFQVRTFTDPLVFLSDVEKNQPQVLFIDYRFPHTNGLEIAKKIQARIPMALITGELEVLDKGPFQVVLSKPFDRELILQFIHKVTSKLPGPPKS